MFSVAAEMNVVPVSSSSSEFSLSSIPDANAPLARPESFTLSSSGMSDLNYQHHHVVIFYKNFIWIFKLYFESI